jgi:hypothetical protein
MAVQSLIHDLVPDKNVLRIRPSAPSHPDAYPQIAGLEKVHLMRGLDRLVRPPLAVPLRSNPG